MNPRRKRKQYRVYREMPLPMRLIASLQVPFLLLGAVLFGNWSLQALVTGGWFGWFGTIFMGSFAYGFLAWFWWIWHVVVVNRLIISDEGVELHAYGIGGFVRWEDIEGIGWRQRGRISVWGLLLSDHVTVSEGSFRKIFGIFQGNNPFAMVISLQHFTKVPRRNGAIDIELFQETPLGLDIAHYAPHLFSEDSPKRKESPSEPHDDLVQTAPDEQRRNSE